MELTKNINGNMGINEEKIILRERLICTQEMHVSFSERRSYLKGLTIAIYIIYHIYQICGSKSHILQNISTELIFLGFCCCVRFFVFFFYFYFYLFYKCNHRVFFLHWIGVQANKTKLKVTRVKRPLTT